MVRAKVAKIVKDFKGMKKDKLTVIVPFLNEEKNLAKLNIKLLKVLRNLEMDSEVIYVDDGSNDESLTVLRNELRKNKQGASEVKIIELKKNFGQTAAVSAGINSSTGNLVSFLDADLQNDPTDIPRFLEKISE